MKALQFSEYGPSSVLHLADVPDPHPGPGEIRIAVKAAGVTPADWYLRSGRFRDFIPLTLPHALGVDAAGVVDEIGPGVTGVRPGDAVFGVTDVSALGGAAAEFAVLAMWAPKPDVWTWSEAGGAAGNVETSTRVLDRLGVGAGSRLLIDGAAGGVGTVAVQLAVARGAAVIGTASAGNHELLTGLGATPTTYGPGLIERVAALGGADLAFDCAGSGSLPDLVAIAGDPARVVSIADLGAPDHGVHLSRSAGGEGADPQATHALADAVALAAQGRLRIPVAAEFPLTDAAAAHDLSESGHLSGKIVLTVL